ncbi:biliverdin-producing heme oxygenase [Brevundimonas aurantiaca]|uniref:biliverdin-producing heme oxygenase n=1 Tax=Brevundimonas aurantiaca TaxID=74316 RepID=UPI00174B09B6|nr:biliverdin-producing heme oxygenase [Brevundimonas aurantiaca]
MIEAETSRAKRLKAATQSVHQGLDDAVMAARPFESRARYAEFLRIQQLFHRDVAALYQNEALTALIPDLAARRRYDAVIADLADLEAEPGVESDSPVFDDQIADIPAALGWLYVAEGSNLGAAFLLKAAAGLGLSEAFGARHLAASPDGRANHWRSFTAALDAAEMTQAQEDRATAGATAAFARVRALVEAHLGPDQSAAA